MFGLEDELRDKIEELEKTIQQKIEINRSEALLNTSLHNDNKDLREHLLKESERRKELETVIDDIENCLFSDDIGKIIKQYRSKYPKE